MQPTFKEPQITDKEPVIILTPEQLVENCKLKFDAPSIVREQDVAKLIVEFRKSKQIIYQYLEDVIKTIKTGLRNKLKIVYGLSQLPVGNTDIVSIIAPLDQIKERIQLFETDVLKIKEIIRNSPYTLEAVLDQIIGFNRLLDSIENFLYSLPENMGRGVEASIIKIARTYSLDERPVDLTKITEAILKDLTKFGIVGDESESDAPKLLPPQEFLREYKIYTQVRPDTNDEKLASLIETSQETYQNTKIYIEHILQELISNLNYLLNESGVNLIINDVTLSLISSNLPLIIKNLENIRVAQNHIHSLIQIPNNFTHPISEVYVDALNEHIQRINSNLVLLCDAVKTLPSEIPLTISSNFEGKRKDLLIKACLGSLEKLGVIETPKEDTLKKLKKRLKSD